MLLNQPRPVEDVEDCLQESATRHKQWMPTEIVEADNARVGGFGAGVRRLRMRREIQRAPHEAQPRRDALRGQANMPLMRCYEPERAAGPFPHRCPHGSALQSLEQRKKMRSKCWRGSCTIFRTLPVDCICGVPAAACRSAACTGWCSSHMRHLPSCRTVKQQRPVRQDRQQVRPLRRGESEPSRGAAAASIVAAGRRERLQSKLGHRRLLAPSVLLAGEGAAICTAHQVSTRQSSGVRSPAENQTQDER